MLTLAAGLVWHKGDEPLQVISQTRIVYIYSLTEPGRPKGISKAGNKREKDFQVEKILYIRRLSLECIHANTDTYTQTHARNRLPNASSTHSTTALPPAGCFFPSCRVRGKKTFFFPLPRYISFSYLCCFVESLAHLQTALRSCCSTPFRGKGSSATILGLGYTIRLLEGENDECFVKFWKFPTSLLPFKSCKRWETNVHPAAIACNSYRSIYKHKDEGIWGLNKIAGITDGYYILAVMYAHNNRKSNIASVALYIRYLRCLIHTLATVWLWWNRIRVSL